MTLTGYFAPEGFEDQLQAELKQVTARYGRLFLAEGPPQPVNWVQNIWYNPIQISIQSIGEGAKKLRTLQRNWALYSHAYHRRAHLIQEQLPKVSHPSLSFPSPLPQSTGSWTLLDPQTMLAAQHCSSPFPHGEVHFNECKEGPPGRAYLKLWEAFTLLQRMPKPGEQCLEIGASPGGWTWVLAQLGVQVLAVDRADLDSSLNKYSNIHFMKKNAFSIKPNDFDNMDWLFSDVICYPEKLYEWIMLWLESGKCKKFICTLKFQGENHYGIIPSFAAIPGSHLVHLFNNKHELTWILGC